MFGLRLFNTYISVNNGTNYASRRLLMAVEHYQQILTDIRNNIQGKIVSSYNPDIDWREMQALQGRVKMDRAQKERLIKATDSVATTLALGLIDFGQKFVIDVFNNTIVDILVQSVFDNTILTPDPGMREALVYWERQIICPVIDHLASTGRLDILSNETLIGEAQEMERWVKYEGDTKRGMFQTIGSMMSKGFFFALRVPCSTPFVPASFMGNLVCWALLITDPEQRCLIRDCLTALRDNPDYMPSAGVIKKIATYQPGALKGVPLDVIMDNKIGIDDLRDAIVPMDIAYQVELLDYAKSIVSAKVAVRPEALLPV